MAHASQHHERELERALREKDVAEEEVRAEAVRRAQGEVIQAALARIVAVQSYQLAVSRDVGNLHRVQEKLNLPFSAAMRGMTGPPEGGAVLTWLSALPPETLNSLKERKIYARC